MSIKTHRNAGGPWVIYNPGIGVSGSLKIEATTVAASLQNTGSFANYGNASITGSLMIDHNSSTGPTAGLYIDSESTSASYPGA